MERKQGWKVKSFFICFVGNAVLTLLILNSGSILGAAPSAGLAAGVAGVVTLILWLLLLAASPADAGRLAPSPASAAAPAPAPSKALPENPAPAVRVL
ncbi:MAG TPA: hypothetical protein VLS90_07795, partial [Thermodesulfobacteriota bacterium]|nr:hypothetical protein [Thermodesulfobacteriota bacterium]